MNVPPINFVEWFNKNFKYAYGTLRYNWKRPWRIYETKKEEVRHVDIEKEPVQNIINEYYGN